MKIAIIAWGSLIWSPRTLEQQTAFKPTGPVLPIEFSRISNDGRLTLVIDEANGTPCQAYFCESQFENLDEAIENLRIREGNASLQHIGYTQLGRNTSISLPSGGRIEKWRQENGFDAAIWTALPASFPERGARVQFTVSNAMSYLDGLSGEIRKRSFEYIQKAPPEIDTPLRRAFKIINK